MDRRDFLRLAGAAAGMLAAPSRLLARARESWQNWSGNQRAAPRAIHFPRDEDALRRILRQGSGTLRPFGASHSFSALVPTDDVLVSLEALEGPRDGASMTFTGGTRIGHASALAWEAGHSFIGEPDINIQSLAGALATSTHGTGLAIPSLSGMVGRLWLMTVEGETLVLDESDGDLFRAALCSLGALGIVTRLQLKKLPRYRLRETTTLMPLRQALDIIDQERHEVRHVELFAFPLGEVAILKRIEMTDRPEDILPEDTSSAALEAVSEITMRAGWLAGPIQRRLHWFVDDEVRQGPSWRVFANNRTVRFNEMEYTVPAERGIECLEEVCDAARRGGHNVFFPLEYRYTAADDSLIGMFSGRAGASISVHTYYRQDHAAYFRALEPIMQRYAGRPHWGKLHGMDRRALAEVIPGLERFREIRRELDPGGRLLNAHLRHLLGESA